MEFAGKRALRNPPSNNMRYSATLYNVEEHEKDVHRSVIVPRMADMKSQDK